MKILFSFILIAVSLSSHAANVTRKMDFVKIKAKEFLMGSADSENGRSFDESLHFVKISQDFELQTTPVTQAQWVSVMKSNPSEFQTKKQCKSDYKKLNGISICADHPVDSVTFSMVQDFIKQLNAKTQNYKYRLPTEAEWELAARAGTGTAYFFSDDGTGFEKYIVYDREKSERVASKRPNQFGLYDMLGNVSQWVNDYYSYYPEFNPEEITVDPMGPVNGDYRIVRGSHWQEYRWNEFRSAHRTYIEANNTNSHIGFRLIRIPNKI